MSEIITIGSDLAKNLFQVHGADGAGRAIMRNTLWRAQVLAFFDKLSPRVVAMEACGVAHYWGLEIDKLGHKVQKTGTDLTFLLFWSGIRSVNQ